MLARNPKTGGQIRVIKSDASIWKDSKTLVWMKEPFSETGLRWKRWDLVVVGVDPKLLAWNPQIVVLTKDAPEVRLWLKTPEAKATRFILVTMALVSALSEEGFNMSELGNVLCLEEYASVYPFLGDPWDGTVEDALVCAAVVFRYNRLIGIQPNHSRLSLLGFDRIALTLEESSEQPEPLVLIQQYYDSKNPKRQAELYKCLQKNLECEFIDTILLYTESKDLKMPPDPLKKLVMIPLKSRITYAKCIETIQTRIGKGHLVAFANADIYLNETWKGLWSVNLYDTFLALLRWEEGLDGNENVPFGPRADSQDTWLIHSDSVMDRSWNLKGLEIPFGQAGCDNAICIEFLRNKFKIVNPSLSIQTIHVHHSEVRTYDEKNIVDRPNYMFIEPSGLHELNPLSSWTGWADQEIPSVQLDRPLKATNPKALPLFCSQMNRDESFLWSADGKNTYSSPLGQDHQIEIMGGAFVSPNGLVYRHTDICVGTTTIQKDAWSSNTLSHLMPTHGVNEMMAFPLQDEWVHDQALYVLHYLSRVMKQREKTPGASFWCKRTEGHLAAIKLFKWDLSKGRLLEYDNQTQVFALKVYGRTAHGVRILPDEIQSLRESMLVNWTRQVDSLSKVVLISDTAHLKGDLLTELHGFTHAAGFSVTILQSHSTANKWEESLSGASHVILSTSAKHLKVSTWAWLWMAPKGCKILELQEEREASDSLLHLSAAAELDWTLLQYPRSTPEGFHKIVMTGYKKWLDKEQSTKPDLPVVYTPPSSMKYGFFGHKGDSFREMVDLWVEKGYVERKEDPSLTHCWLNSIGADGVLLYDRPTWAWLDKAPEKEQVYKKCLVGNPDFTQRPQTAPWIFWPRNPRLVEELAALLSRRKFCDRLDRLVFFGRVENDEQGKWRTNAEEWLSICSKFSMPVGAKQPYALSPRDYLEALSNSRYGLCLRGYGPKCNREIELLSTGTVPVVVEGVDMDNYMEPLKEGVHYIRVSGPEDARNKMASITESEWTTMSKAGHQWWKENASVEGSWSKTKQCL